MDFSDAVDISSSYLLIADRICEEDISGGNCCEAISRNSNSCSRKPTANFTDSDTVVSSAVLFVTFRGRVGGFEEGSVPLFLGRVEVCMEFWKGSKPEGNCEDALCGSCLGTEFVNGVQVVVAEFKKADPAISEEEYSAIWFRM
jgi:hypothetical protein